MKRRDGVGAVIATDAPMGILAPIAIERQWHDVRILSTAGNTYQADYRQKYGGGVINLFEKTKDGVFHFFPTEDVSAALMPLW